MKIDIVSRHNAARYIFHASTHKTKSSDVLQISFYSYLRHVKMFDHAFATCRIFIDGSVRVDRVQ